MSDCYVETLNCKECRARFSIVNWPNEYDGRQEVSTRANVNWRSLISRDGSGPREGASFEATFSFPFVRIEAPDAFLDLIPTTNGRYWYCTYCERLVESQCHPKQGW